ncbi:MAG: hypothetical protein ACJ797_13025 [Ktedonobacteraceae bacterium]
MKTRTSDNKETDVVTPVPIMLVLAGVVIHVVCIEEGMRSTQP